MLGGVDGRGVGAAMVGGARGSISMLGGVDGRGVGAAMVGGARGSISMLGGVDGRGVGAAMVGGAVGSLVWKSSGYDRPVNAQSLARTRSSTSGRLKKSSPPAVRASCKVRMRASEWLGPTKMMGTIRPSGCSRICAQRPPGIWASASTDRITKTGRRRPNSATAVSASSMTTA